MIYIANPYVKITTNIRKLLLKNGMDSQVKNMLKLGKVKVYYYIKIDAPTFSFKHVELHRDLREGIRN